ncbi:hypothetical protein PS2_001471 [Malus domestica]
MQARSVGVFAVSTRADKEHLVPCCNFSSCRQGALVLPFMLVQTKSVWCRVAVSARAGKERWCCLLCSCRPGAFGSCSLGSFEQGAFGVAFYARADQELSAM